MLTASVQERDCLLKPNGSTLLGVDSLGNSTLGVMKNLPLTAVTWPGPLRMPRDHGREKRILPNGFGLYDMAVMCGICVPITLIQIITKTVLWLILRARVWDIYLA
jgi:hypothetical protein